MFRYHSWPLGVVGIVLAICCNAVFGHDGHVQGLTPKSGAGGNASREVSQIYRQGVGTGYSGSSLNHIALNSARARIPNVGQSTSAGAGRIGLGIGASGPAAKPFSNYSPAPTVSPYMNLFREDLDGNSDFNYQTLVRPMLQQQQFNQQLQREAIDTAQRLQQISAQADFNPEGSKSQVPTGHQTVFMYYGHFYPTANRQRR
jgi:hypothetical protein